MTTVTTDAPFPPTTTQIKAGPGTLVSIVNAGQTNNVATAFPGAFVNTGSAKLKASFYDSANAAGATGTPLVSIDTAQGYAPVVLNLSFTKGLFVVQQSGSSIQVTTA
jgi:hypothetical protein